MTDNERKIVPMWRRVLPFVIGAALIAIVAVRIDFHAFVASLEHTHFIGLIGLGVGFSIALLLADCFASLNVYKTLVCDITFNDLVVLRAASYLPGLINFNVGQAWLTYAIAKRCNTSVLRVTSGTLLVYATTFAGIFALGGASLLIDHARFSWLPPAIAAFGVAGAIYIALLALKPGLFARFRITAPLAQAGLRGNLVATLYRVPYVLVLFLGTWLPFRLGNVDIPLVDALALIPPLILIVAVPITPQGVGTRDAFSIQVFGSYALGATVAERSSAIAAVTLSWAVLLTLLQIPISLPFVRRAARLTTESERS